jgi:hypothetical protein
VNDELLTLDEVAARLKISPETARKLCVTGKLAWVPRGTGSSRQFRGVRRDTLEAYMRNERHGAVKQQMDQIKQTFGAMKLVEERW